VSATELDETHSDACLSIAAKAGYKGPFVLVNGGRGECDWEAMDIQRSRLLRH